MAVLVLTTVCVLGEGPGAWTLGDDETDDGMLAMTAAGRGPAAARAAAAGMAAAVIEPEALGGDSIRR